MVYVFESATDFVAVVGLDDIYCLEERGRRISWTEEQLARIELPQTSNKMGVTRTDRTLQFRFRSVFTDREAEYVADWEAKFELPDEVEGFPVDQESLSEPVVQEFARRVAFFAVYPYLRSSIYGSASRLNLQVPVLGIVRQGEFELGEAMSDSDVRESFHDVVSERVEQTAHETTIR